MNYSKITLAALMALLFVACSEESKPMGALGGTEEETALNNIKLAGRAMRVSLPADDRRVNEWSSTAEVGAVIRMAELDSVTLDTTGVVYYTKCMGAAGEFSFDSVSLNSPYVMFELAPYVENGYWIWDGNWSFEDYNSSEGAYMVTYSVIVDVRKTRDVDINVMTYLETARLRHLVKQGKSFAEAKQQADREVLDALGLYDETFDYDKSSYVDNEKLSFVLNYMDGMVSFWTQKRSSLIITKSFGANGTLSAVDSIREFLVNRAYGLKDSERIDEGSKNILYNIVSGLYGLGKCTSELEGSRTETLGDSERYMDVSCLSGQWIVSNGRYKMAEIVPSVAGGLTDDRDGTVYKTVTFNIDGLSQTWMAENLRYSDENIQPMTHFDSNRIEICQGLDGSYLSYLASLDSTYWNTVSLYKEADVVGGDSVAVDGVPIQGVCPSGWHIPTLKDWSRLLYLVEKASGACDKRDCSDFIEKESLGHYASRYLHQVGFGDFTYEPFVFAERVGDTWRMQAIEMINWKAMIMDDWSVYGWPYGYLSVRCVKN